jgi:hypothetical protein
MAPPGLGFFFFTLPSKLLAVSRRQEDGAFPKLGPGGMSTAGLLDAIGRHVQRTAATLLGPGDIEVGAVAAIRIAMTSAVRIAATAGGLGQAALDHDPGGAKELAEERLLPNHIIMLGIMEDIVNQKCTLRHGIYSRKCENRASERCILRRKVAIA